MALVVQKYGGSSVANLDKIRNVAKRVKTYVERGDKVVVVVSAMKGETDKLIGYANEINKLHDEREHDALVSTGENVTSALLAISLIDIGVPARSFHGHQIRILTDSSFTAARIIEVEEEAIRVALDENRVAVVAGFQGVDENDNITTLGRGGSDTTGVALAVALKADVCEIFTDVTGVFTADPRIVGDDARKLDRISYEEMIELASLGSKVLQIRSVEFGMKYGMPIHVRSTFSMEEGTIVTAEEPDMEQVIVTGVAHDMKEAKITVSGVPDKPGVAYQLFQPLSDANVVVDMIIQNASAEGTTDLTFTIPKDDFAKAMPIVKKTAGEMGVKDVIGDTKIAKVSIVGIGMRSHAGVATKMFRTLSENGINILMISTSEIKISCVIEDKFTELAVRVLHDAFELNKPPAGKEKSAEALHQAKAAKGKKKK